jgi:formylglycine-generating enzyme required for sulfatase activity
MRFTNWLHNGQPTGPQNENTTEDGAYRLNGGTIDAELFAVTRKPGARWWLPNEDEWYKAAYHSNDGATGNYWDFPNGTDSLPDNNRPSDDTGNSANFLDGNFTTGDSNYPLTDAGAYKLSRSPYGTFDQGGNVWEWIDTVGDFGERGIRGGAWNSPDAYYGLFAGRSDILGNLARESDYIGFRVAKFAIPEPSSLFLSNLAIALVLRSRRRDLFGSAISRDLTDRRRTVILV